ncbi:hypothetical protein LPC08_11870 [Roseomonas sp. OT10]|uniref:hypothetical protein n=1 Tax=Roseomonas cutis TaxID=2897332 RepID=UPI001E34D5C9|nr:hypothetical protein [Roseomonas sp. OT10]UFN51245.1 hypothetical protein LPC08_11870 [Roseomonas sp. OT10]
MPDPTGPAAALRDPATPPAPDGEADALLAMLLGALSTGETVLSDAPSTPALRDAAAALRRLGVPVEERGAGHWHICGRGIGGLAEPAVVLEAGGSDMLAQLLLGLLAGHAGFAVLAGERTAPLPEALTVPLVAGGARLTARGAGGLPLAIEGSGMLLPLDCAMAGDGRDGPGPATRAALLVAALCARGTSLVPAGSGPAAALARRFGAGVSEEGPVLRVEGQPELRGLSLRFGSGSEGIAHAG